MRKKIASILSIFIFFAISSSCGVKPPAPTTTSTLPISTATVESMPAAGDIKVSEVDGMEMIYVPAGEFIMGNNNGASYERPEHIANVDAFWIDKTEVTNAMFANFIDEAGTALEVPEIQDTVSFFNPFTGGQIHKDGEEWTIETGFENHPVVNVTWYGAQAYCDWTGRTLPSEAQWEKAARGADGRLYPWGNTFACQNGNFDDESTIDAFTVEGGSACDSFSDTAPVGSFPAGASPYGALDMGGNVWEWTSEQFSDYSYSQTPAIVPTSILASELIKLPPDVNGCPHPGEFCDSLMEPDQYRVMRGGSWFSDELSSTTFTRDWNHIMESTYPYLGFRCALAP
jgi:formylglycine-generating enzyme required for sulfatase activity